MEISSRLRVVRGLAVIGGACYLQTMTAKLRRAAASSFLALTLALSCLGADGNVEANRIRQTALETILSVRRAIFKTKASYLGQVDGQIRELMAADASSSGDAEAPDPARLQDMIRRGVRLQYLESERVRTLQSMQELTTEMVALQAELDRVRSSLDKSRQIMEGRWVVTIMPMGTRGDVFLSQNGTILTGDYTLDNGQQGSLQGLFVKDQVVLERIDANYGKMGRFEGTLSKDRTSVKGTWYSYDLSSGQPVTGAFTMDKVQEDQGP